MSLAQFLQHHQRRIASLTELLRQERQLLGEGEINGARLTDIAHTKQRSLEEINFFEQQRRQTLQRLGYRDDRDGDEQAARDAACLDQWQQLTALAREAAELNRTNGVMIGIRSESNQRLLNTLQEAAGKALYGPDGRARNRTGKVSSRA
ncbi:flagella synthesis protein FlgN [Microbulbifer harenosus]|uniref:Flagellar protein FlgN n=1 Tax=Microbulbifer harenosus TaxID=2576840 RepID=A0ABY2UQE5_9GAMM|nr:MULTISPECIES: flagellar protein FlgN [Microbulbifer]QIL89910.1 flagellar protein FlgN [Microbulbifer sp. SH-1]TLM79956.1 flagellar protein FlgN [Microbulbifer harenosus]